MKRLGIGIAVILVLALLLCQRKEEVAAEKALTASSKSSSIQREEDGSPFAGGKPTKVRQRPEQPKVAKTPVAKPVKGRPGFVYHPEDGRILDVRGVSAGTMVRNSGVFFLVPKMGYIITPEAAMKTLLPLEGGTEVVSCRPMYPEARWDDGAPVMPGDAPGTAEGS
jgi:hypothetical protein